MANYYGVGRSNYVRVRDEAAFRAALAPYPVEVITGDDGRVAILDNHPDGGGFAWYIVHDDACGCDNPTCTVGDDATDEISLLAPHLADGEVMILTETGHEKYRYVLGYALAFNNAGEQRYLNLGDITTLAKELGPNVTDPSY